MESEIVVNQDSSGRTIVLEKQKPWGWGRTGYGYQSAYVIAWFFLICFKRKKTVFDEKTQTLKFKNKIIPFDSIKSVEASVYSEVYCIDTDGNSAFLSICDLELLLIEGKRLHLGTAWLNDKTKDIGQKIAALTKKPFIWPEEEAEQY
ncbi:MAG: hypothetical protein NTV30_01485 [Chloroflexi bacterium]|nr:hypothetical protein [Chloroflexota bacterium]